MAHKSRYCGRVYDEMTGRLKPKHVVIWQQHTGIPVPDGYDIHHIDGNGHNNDPNNLVALPRSTHIRLHNEMRKLGIDPIDSTDESVIRAREASKRYYETHIEKEKERHKGAYRKYRNRDLSYFQEKDRQYREAHKDKIHAYLEEYRKTHKEENRENGRRYREEHRDELIEYSRQYYKDHHDELMIQKKRYNDEHASERRAFMTEYNEKHRRLIQAKNRLRYAIKTGKPQSQILKLQHDVELEMAREKDCLQTTQSRCPQTEVIDRIKTL